MFTNQIKEVVREIEFKIQEIREVQFSFQVEMA